MNKKIIAIAIATAMAAPVAMADVKISGRVQGELVFADDKASAGQEASQSARSFADNGQGRLQFDATSGKFYARLAYVTGLATGTSATPFKDRDVIVGYKLGGGSTISAGRLAGAAKNIEKDPLIASFLQFRKSSAEAVTGSAFGSSGFVNNLVEFATKAGGAKIKLQLDPTDNSKAGYSGAFAASVTGKAGPVAYFASYNNGQGTKKHTAAVTAVAPAQGVAGTSDDTAGVTGVTEGSSTVKQTNTKFGGSMKFGKVKATLILTSSDNEGTKDNATAIMANMGLGGGSAVNVAYATNKAKDTWTRVAWTKKMNKGTRIHVGAVSNSPKSGSATTTFGAGVLIKF